MHLSLSFDTNLFGLLGDLNEHLSSLAEKLSINSLILYLVVAAMALVVGLLGMHLIKAFGGFLLGLFGYFAGIELFVVLGKNVEWIGKLPDYVGLIVGAVIAVLAFILGWKKNLHVMFLVFFAVGFMIVSSFLDNTLLALGGAVLLAVLYACLVKFFVVVLTSLAGGFTLVSLVGGLLPKVEYLQLADGNTYAILIAAAVALLFAIIQFVATRNYESN